MDGALSWLQKPSAQDFFFSYGGSDNCGSFLTSHLSKLPWVRNQGLNHTHCDSASKAGCKNIMTSPVWLQDRLCLSSLPTQKPLGAAAGHETQEECPTEACGNWGAREPRRVCCQTPGWSVEKSAELQLPGGRRVTSAQDWEKPHHCGVQNHQGKILPERQTTTHLGFLPTTCQVWTKQGEIWKSFTPTNSVCKWSCSRAETLFGPNQSPTHYFWPNAWQKLSTRKPLRK